MGFGPDHRIHTCKILRLSDDLPVVIEIVDTDENLEKLTPFLDESIQQGLITRETVDILKYIPRNK